MRSCRARSSSHMSSRNSASSAPSGSSIRKAFGRRTMARPSATRWRSPPARPRDRLVEEVVDAQEPRRLLDAARGSRRAACPGTSSGKPMFSPHVHVRVEREELEDEGDVALASARLKVTSSPPSRMSPEVGSSRPAIMRSVVVLPQPEGPSRHEELAVLDGEVRVAARRRSRRRPCGDSRPGSAAMRAQSGKWLTTTNIDRAGEDGDEATRCRASARTAASA